MSETYSPEEIRKHVRIYITVFAALAVLTVATVGASYLNLPIAGIRAPTRSSAGAQ